MAEDICVDRMMAERTTVTKPQVKVAEPYQWSGDPDPPTKIDLTSWIELPKIALVNPAGPPDPSINDAVIGEIHGPRQLRGTLVQKIVESPLVTARLRCEQQQREIEDSLRSRQGEQAMSGALGRLLAALPKSSPSSVDFVRISAHWLMGLLTVHELDLYRAT
jgi:hypothetical protein